MKTTYLLSLCIAVSIVMVSCSETEPTLEEKIESGITKHYQVDSLAYMKITDTLFVADLDSLISTYEESITIYQESNEISQREIDSAKVRLKEAEESLESISFDMLKPFAEENVATWKSIITKQEANILLADSMIAVGQEKIDYYESAKSGAVENKAFYTVKIKINGGDKVVDVNPQFAVIGEFDE